MDAEITLCTSVDDWFERALSEVVEDSREALSPVTQSYLVTVLSDACRDPSMHHRAERTPIPMLLAEAEEKPRVERFEHLRRVGDSILLSQGFFHRTRRDHASEEYFLSLGRIAYERASRIMAGPLANPTTDPLLELAHQMRRWTLLLRRLARHLLARSKNEARDLVALCELWVKERTPELARLLRGRGVDLTRGPLLA